MPENPYQSPEAEGKQPIYSSKRSLGITVLAVGLVTLFSLIGGPMLGYRIEYHISVVVLSVLATLVGADMAVTKGSPPSARR